MFESIPMMLTGTQALLTQLFSTVRQPTGLASLDGKVAIVTGANSGIGFETARGLVGLGAQVIVACRSLEKGEQAIKAILTEFPSKGGLDNIPVDLASLKSIQEFSKAVKNKYSKIHILVNNAGVMLTPYGKTTDGFETQFGTNHIGSFYLTLSLLDVITRSGTPENVARIVNVSSSAYRAGYIKWDDINSEKSYNNYVAYGQSKLANALFTAELQKRLSAKSANVSVSSVHPGVVNSGLYQHLHWLVLSVQRPLASMFFLTNSEGAWTSLYAAASTEVEKDRGVFYCNCQKHDMLPHAFNAEDARRLWELTEKLIKEKNFPVPSV